MALRVIQPGTHATVQDQGRPGWRGVGVPVGGAFDRTALAVANALVGNPADAAALELAGLGGTYEAEGPLYCALAGAPLRIALHTADGLVRRLEPPVAFALTMGDRLVLGGAAYGARAVLAVRGGFQTEPVLGSRSTETPLRAGDRLPALWATGPLRRWSEGTWGDAGPAAGTPTVLRALDGPDCGHDWPRPWEALELRVSAAADRMGLRLDGPAVPAPGVIEAQAERLSAPVTPGAVQWVEGALIVLGVAAGTMGGYPHVAQVISPDLDRLAQLRPGDRVTLRRVELAEARALDRTDRLERRRLRLRLGVAASEGIRDLVGPADLDA